MRLRVTLGLDRPARLPVNHQDLLAALVYDLLRRSDDTFARFLHDQGYPADDGTKRMKFFVFSGLRVPKSRRRVTGDYLEIAPGPLTWLISSPRAEFLRHEATGLLTAGDTLRVGSAQLTIQQVESVATPVFAETTRFTCLSPIVASVPRPDRTTQYLRPSDGLIFSEAVRGNLRVKYNALHDREPADTRLHLTFDPDFLARSPHDGTKKITFKNTDIIGAFAPFTLTGSTELMHLAWECGLGEKNSAGFGMVDVQVPTRDGGLQ